MKKEFRLKMICEIKPIHNPLLGLIRHEILITFSDKKGEKSNLYRRGSVREGSNDIKILDSIIEDAISLYEGYDNLFIDKNGEN